MTSFIQDIKYSFRMLLQKPLFTVIVLVLLVLGIGANTTIFSFINATLLRPIQGVEAPEQLVAVYTSDYSSSLYGTTSYPDYKDFREQGDAFSNLAAYGNRTMVARINDEFERLRGVTVSGNYFETLGADATVGRMLQSSDDLSTERMVVVLSHGLWTRRFGADPGVVGTAITLGNRSYTIVGVAARDFTSTRIDVIPAFWTLISAQPVDLTGNRGARWLRMVGRLAPNVTLAQAQAQMTAIMADLAEQYPDSNMGTLRVPDQPRPMTVVHESRLGPQMDETIGTISWLLMAVVGVVLLIACVNIANLLMARASVRRQEIAVRLALGANRLRLIRQLMTESMLLALIGGVITLVMTLQLADLIPALLPDGDTIHFDFSLDYRMLWFTFGLSILTGLLFGLIPALQTSNPSLVPSLKNDTAMPTRGLGRFNFRHILVIGQISLSLMLMIGAGLFIRSLNKAAATDLGFNSENLLIASVNVNNVVETPEQGIQFYEQLPERIEALPGVRSVTLSRVTPLVRGGRTVFRFESYTPQPQEDMELPFNVAGLNHFSTLGIPVTQGRDFIPQDRMGGAPVIIINEEAAQRYFAGQDPIGKRIYNGPVEYEVIGVVGTAKYWNIREAPRPFLYWPFAQRPNTGMQVIIRTEGDPVNIVSAVRAAVQNLNKNVPIVNITTVNEVISEALALDRMMTVLSSIFGGIAFVLAVIGLYGVMAYAVTQRTREIGVRMALGAQDNDVLKMVLGHGMLLAVIGIGLGLVGAFVVTRFISGMLYDVSTTDPITFAVVAITLTVVALFACYIPARRAVRVDPMVALRYE